MSKSIPTEVLHARLGGTLVLLQYVEQALRVCADGVFGTSPAESLEAWLYAERTDQRALGRLISALEANVELDEAFSHELGHFRRERNRFVHHLQDDFNLGTPDGREAAFSFAQGLADRAVRLLKVFAAALHARDPSNIPEGTEDFVAELDVAAVPRLFKPKKRDDG